MPHKFETNTLQEIVKEYQNGLTKYSSQYALILNEKHSNGATNLLYYKNSLDMAAEHLSAQLIEVPYLEDCSHQLQLFNHLVFSLLENTAELFISCTKYESIEQSDKLFSEIIGNQEVCIQNLTRFTIQIEREIVQGNLKRAEKIKNYCLYNLKWIPIYVENHLFIDVANSPMGRIISELQETFARISVNTLAGELDTDPLSSQSERHIQLVYNPSHWSTNTFKFFKYLFDHYYLDERPTKSKLITVWFYLKYDLNIPTFMFKMTKQSYVEMILNVYGITITNLNKPENYLSEKRSLKNHFDIFQAEK